MRFFMVTTRMGSPIQANSPEHALSIAEDQDFGLPEVSEVIQRGGTWVRVGELHNIAGMRRTIPCRLSTAEFVDFRAALAEDSTPHDLDGILDGNPVTIRIIHERVSGGLFNS
jgi:hypothetical protein